jgi:hypothetical protein
VFLLAFYFGVLITTFFFNHVTCSVIIHCLTGGRCKSFFSILCSVCFGPNLYLLWLLEVRVRESMGIGTLNRYIGSLKNVILCGCINLI